MARVLDVLPEVVVRLYTWEGYITATRLGVTHERCAAQPDGSSACPPSGALFTSRVVYGFSSTLSITVFWYMLSEEPGVRSMPFAVLPRKKDIFGRGVASPGSAQPRRRTRV